MTDTLIACQLIFSM